MRYGLVLFLLMCCGSCVHKVKTVPAPVKKARQSQADCALNEQYHDFQCIPYEQWDDDDECKEAYGYERTCLRNNLKI